MKEETAKEKKVYVKPAIVHELNLEVRAGSCREDSPLHKCDDKPFDPSNPLGLPR